MPRTIHKYPLSPVTQVSTYERAQFLHVALQDDTPTVWAEVNTLERECVRTVVNVPTGGDVPLGATYLGTVVGVEGWMVFHAYLLPEGESSLPPATPDAERPTEGEVG